MSFLDDGHRLRCPCLIHKYIITGMREVVTLFLILGGSGGKCVENSVYGRVPPGKVRNFKYFRGFSRRNKAYKPAHAYIVWRPVMRELEMDVWYEVRTAGQCFALA
jgi:hypothetical protein